MQGCTTDIYFSADVETDGPIPGPYSMLSFALVYAGKFDGKQFTRPRSLDQNFSAQLRPIAENYQEEALQVNGLDREHLLQHGLDPKKAMRDAAHWVRSIAGAARPVLVAYPLSFDWTWLYWYFMNFSRDDSPFNHSACFDLKTAYAVKANIPIARAKRELLCPELRASRPHTHDALEDACEQAEIFGNLFEWKGSAHVRA